AVVFIFLLTVAHYLFVVEPFDYANKDFMSLWTGGKALLTRQNPYDPDVWRAMRTQYGSNWFPDERAPFPLWTFVFTAPLSLLPIPLASALWMAATETALVLSVFLIVMKLVDYHPSLPEKGLLFLGSVFSVVTLLVLINGQMTAFLLAILVGCLLLVKRDLPFAAGLLLALLASKPNAFIVFVPLLGVWLLARRRWRMIAGGCTGILVMYVVSWFIQPGWLPLWLNVQGKTAVATITPTIWGLSAELAGEWWLPVGLALTVVIVGGVGWLCILSRHRLGDASVVSLAVAVSLLITPYTWSYEHALLYLPWAWGFAIIPLRKQANVMWIMLSFIVPWLLFVISVARINESLSFLSPLLAIIAVVYAQKFVKVLPT
ncbi:MAG TPA: DUF2029 domain-containing protein, partial [Anaerolineae bacterium]|nr:DUF2029 domain-containing protein [Anaerolineae bacterium]